MGRFEGKVAVITGGASGIGLGTAKRFVAEGARVVLGDVNGAAVEAAVADLGSGNAVGVECDVTDEAAVERLVAAAVELGGPDIGVNCAGVGTLAPLLEHPVEEWDRVVSICLKGVFLSVKHEARAMKEAGGGGVIVNIASINARQPGDGMAAYCSAKAGVEMLTRVAAMELGRLAIRVVGIGPGLVETPLTGFAREFPGVQDAYVENSPLGRTGTVDDVVNAITWLASDEASWVSGDTLFIDGAALTRQYPRFFDLFGLAP